MGFPDGSDGKESTCNAGDLVSIPGLGRHSVVSHTDHVPLEAMNIELSRQESVSRL